MSAQLYTSTLNPTPQKPSTTLLEMGAGNSTLQPRPLTLNPQTYTLNSQPDTPNQGLSLSLYGRLVRLGLEPYFLDTQFRSHPKLVEFVAAEIYGGKLKSGVTGTNPVDLWRCLVQFSAESTFGTCCF